MVVPLLVKRIQNFAMSVHPRAPNTVPDCRTADGGQRESSPGREEVFRSGEEIKEEEEENESAGN